MRVFISMPMSGKTEKQISEELEQAKKDFAFSDSEFINGFLPDHEGMTPLECLAESIKRMDTADAVLFAYGSGWENARGCRVEHAVAENYDIPIYE